MSAAAAINLDAYCQDTAAKARVASRQLATLSTAAKNKWLNQSASGIEASIDQLIAANKLDVAAAPGFGLTEAQIDRLVLTPERIQAIADAVRQIEALADPVGETITGTRRPNGLEIRKVRVPLGTVFFIYESRPNVTVDAAAICVKSGNAVILRGGKEAAHSSRAFVEIMQQAAKHCDVPENSVQLVATSDREAVGKFLSLSDQIDVAIPRGGKGLIERVVREAKMPVIKHFDGNCHVYLDQSADLEMAKAIVVNAKCQRMGVCNACESLLVHRGAAERLLPSVLDALAENRIEVRGDAETRAIWPTANLASDEDWGAEYLGPIISCKIVEDVESAIEHINHFGSHHTDAIVTGDLAASQQFTASVDSSAVVVNASTRFNDGGEFGFGAEIGISTDKLHARGPCGLQELTTYKYIVVGTGQTR